jgi:hypothetical protein
MNMYEICVFFDQRLGVLIFMSYYFTHISHSMFCLNI